MVAENTLWIINAPDHRNLGYLDLHRYFTTNFRRGRKFNGTWSIDHRSKEEQKRGVECGLATFSLVQTGNRITGNHVFSTAGCGRLNEGGDGTVKGVIVEKTAVLVVTSGRNGAIVMGTATVKGNSLFWETVHEIKQGEPEGDSPLILGKGRLTREKLHENYP